MGMTNPGPILAERETLHDGEPIYDLAWGPDPLPDPHAGHRLGSALSINSNTGDPSTVTPRPGAVGVKVRE